MKRRKITLGLSGGVDSAVAGYLLKESGYDVHAVFMQNWFDSFDGSCLASEDLSDAQKVADQLGLPLDVVDFSLEYKNEVFKEFLDDFNQGFTPNPDILCNPKIKFNHLLKYALTHGSIGLATGHYAKINRTDKSYLLEIPQDRTKDQTYFLCQLTEAQLKYAYFPLASMTKQEVRAIAKKIGLSVSNKKDSTGICFIGERKFDQFLEQYIMHKKDPIYSEDGKRIGIHNGLEFYTIGQRKGLHIGGHQDYHNGAPWYVSEKNIAKNSLVVVQGSKHQSLFKTGCITQQSHSISGVALPIGQEIQGRLRHRGSLQPCKIITASTDSVKVIFTSPQRAITPGQFIAFYHQNTCLGSAKIIESFN